MNFDWIDTAKRVIATACETAIALIPAGVMVQEVDWKVIAGTTALSAIVTFLKCVVSQMGTDTMA